MNKTIISIFFLFFNICIIKYPSLMFNASLESINFWLFKLTPSLLPVIVLNNLIQQSNIIDSIPNKLFSPLAKLLKLSPLSTKYFLLGQLSGFPIGASLCANNLEASKISKRDFRNALCLTNNCSATFIIYTLGFTLLGDMKIGFYIFLVQLIATITTGAIFNKKYIPYYNHTKATSAKDFSTILTTSVYNATFSIVVIGGYIVFFSSITQIFLIFLGDTSVLGLLIAGIFEFSSGASKIASSNMPLKIPAIIFIINFGSLSVYFQTLSFIQKVNCNNGFYIKMKLIQATIALIIALAFELFYSQLIAIQTINMYPNDNDTLLYHFGPFINIAILSLSTYLVLIIVKASIFKKETYQ